MERAEGQAKGTMVLATVKGDVHDIGKNLVDIILTNNGYKVVNLGIKVPVEQMLHAADEHHADCIGMSGLLVKSTVIMKENLEVMNERGITLPVILGGAALTRRYVEEDLRKVYPSRLAYGSDAFSGLHFMEELSSGKSGIAPKDSSSVNPVRKARRAEVQERRDEVKQIYAPKPVWQPVEIPQPPFFGTKVMADIPLESVFPYVNPIALYRGQWQVRRGKLQPAEYEKIIKEKFEPILLELQKRCIAERMLTPQVVQGYFPCNSDGDDVVIFDAQGEKEIERFTFPRQAEGNRLCISDFFAPLDSGRGDVIGMMVVTVGQRAAEISRKLFESDKYADYLYFHGLSVETAEALAEYWHKQMRAALGFGSEDASEAQRIFQQGYRGSRYSFGYPACPHLEDQARLFRLLQPQRIGLSLSEGFQLIPEQSTSAIIVHHPAARYFNV
jgi:5-methyltetrahydrofolate--homocysteine methyltransferase